MYNYRAAAQNLHRRSQRNQRHGQDSTTGSLPPEDSTTFTVDHDLAFLYQQAKCRLLALTHGIQGMRYQGDTQNDAFFRQMICAGEFTLRGLDPRQRLAM